MSRSRIVSLVGLVVLLCCATLPALAAGPNVVPDGLTAVPGADPTWLDAIWSWLRGLLESL